MRRLLILAIAFGCLGSLTTVWAGSDEAITRNELGAKFFREGRLEEAASSFQAAVREDATYLPARINLAHAYEGLNRHDEAIREYRAAIALQPQDFFAHNNLGVLLDKKGQYAEAVTEFESALRSRPGDAMALKNLETAKKNQAIMQDRQVQIQRAENDAQAKPKDPTASYRAAQVHAAYGNKASALQWLNRSLQQGYDSSRVKNDPVFTNLRNDRDFELLLIGK